MAHTQFIKRTLTMIIYPNGQKIFTYRHFNKIEKIIYRIFYRIKIVEDRY